MSKDNIVPKEKFELGDIIRLLAEGKSPSEVVNIAFSRGHAIDKKYVEIVKRDYADMIAEESYSQAQDLMRKVPRANKFLRVKKMDEICEHLEEIITPRLEAIESDQTGELNLTSSILKGVELLTKIYRSIAEETHDITPLQKQTNTWVSVIQLMTPDQRQEFMKSAKELKGMIDAGENTIDVDFDAKDK